MTKIYHVSGPGTNRPMRKGFTLMNRHIGDISEGELSLMIARDNMVAKRDIVARKRGIGSIKAQKFQNTIDVMDDAMFGLRTPDPVHYMALIEEDILSGAFSQENEMHGIGCPVTIGKLRANKTVARRANREKRMNTEMVSGIGAKKSAAKPKTKTGNFLKKAATKTGSALKNVANKTKVVAQKTGGAVKKAAQATGKAVKKAAKTLVKVALTPAQLVAKGILEILLPQSAPFFLYLFINDPKIIAKLPMKVARKRAKALKIKNFIVNTIGMKDEHFMGIIRNGIMKKMGASPETILSKNIQKISGIGNPDDGIGVVGLAVASQAAPVVIEIIKKLVAAFKKKKDADLDPTADDAPSDKDWEGVALDAAVDLSTSIKKQNDLPEPNEEVAPSTKEAAPQQSFSKEESATSEGNDAQTTANIKKFREEQNEAIKKDEQARDEDNKQNAAYYKDAEGNEYRNGVKVEPDTDANGEIKKPNEFATGGRKGWNSLGK